MSLAQVELQQISTLLERILHEPKAFRPAAVQAIEGAPPLAPRAPRPSPLVRTGPAEAAGPLCASLRMARTATRGQLQAGPLASLKGRVPRPVSRTAGRLSRLGVTVEAMEEQPGLRPLLEVMFTKLAATGALVSEILQAEACFQRHTLARNHSEGGAAAATASPTSSCPLLGVAEHMQEARPSSLARGGAHS